MSPETLQSFYALAVGFAVAGALASGYQAMLHRPPSFRLLEKGPGAVALAAVPFLVFAAPFIIMRNTLRGRRFERRRIEFVFIATVISGVWSLTSGTVLVMALQASGL